MLNGFMFYWKSISLNAILLLSNWNRDVAWNAWDFYETWDYWYVLYTLSLDGQWVSLFELSNFKWYHCYYCLWFLPASLSTDLFYSDMTAWSHNIITEVILEAQQVHGWLEILCWSYAAFVFIMYYVSFVLQLSTFWP